MAWLARKRIVSGAAAAQAHHQADAGHVERGFAVARRLRRAVWCAPLLEHDPEKWEPVFRKDHAPTKKLDHDPIQLDRIMV
jgi:hypothetical protein